MTDDIVARLRDGKNWLNGGACCGDVDDAECCAAPACIFGEALKQFYEAADEIERLTRELAYMTVQRDQWRGTCASHASRAEAAERERDWHKSLTQSHDLLADNAAQKTRAEAAEAKVARLREALKPFAMLAHRLDYKNSPWLDHETHWMRVVNFNPEPTVGDLRRARAVLQETE